MSNENDEEVFNFDPVYTCPECGNSSHFYEEGFAKLKVETQYHLDNKRKVVAATDNIDVDWSNFDPDTVICAECGVKVG